ncbi:hypothetical protein Dda_4657 [Drechslerella dactyloides]|uniref:Amidase domain-containing protein n=1 Tax=Drechslerella dactyloides TaxID=74499 RepID=A0AAD6J1J2_DREDA|nr:hypothetical protein Dda_4657 [Drechslerella dactyloides]
MRDTYTRICGLLAIFAALLNVNTCTGSADWVSTVNFNTNASTAADILVDAGDRKFLLSNKAVGSIDGNFASANGSAISLCAEPGLGDTYTPITILDCPSGSPQLVSAAWLDSTVSAMLAADDVFCSFFLDTLVFRVPDAGHPPPTVARETDEVFQRMGVRRHYFLQSKDRIASGPYFLREGGKIVEAMRVYDDPYGAFLYGVVQDGDGFARAPTNLIPVHSRLYSTPSASLPLAGKRIAVKDIIDLRNLPTAASSRAYAAYHGPANATALAVQKLLSLGAIVIGKTKTTQFANGEAARDWIEDQCPFNPRADGYLDPAGSSTGSAAAVAGYDWVDYALGTDTCGSVIWPAALQGVYGLRPSLGVSELHGVMPASKQLDTIGFFTRGIDDFKLLQQVWYRRDARTPQTKLSKIVVPKGIFDQLPANKRSVIAKFVDDVTKITSLPKVDLDIDRVWRSSKLTAANVSYTDYLYSTVAHIQIWDSHAHEFRFYNNYRERFGKTPHINPQILHKWAIRANITEAEYADAVTRKETFKKFLISRIFNDGAIMVLPAGGVAPMYRDELIPPESINVYLQSFGFDDSFYSILGGLPSVILPVGQRSVVSRVTGGTVWEPVSMMIVGPAGSEARIIELVRKVLKHSGRQTAVQVGAAAYLVD